MINLKSFVEQLLDDQHREHCFMPEKKATAHFVEDMIRVLFPLQTPHNSQEYLLRFRQVGLQFEKLLYSIRNLISQDTEQVREEFFSALPDIYRKLRCDAGSICAGDPAANSVQEVIHAYPGFYAIAVYRLSHQLVLQKIPVLPRVFAEYAHGQTGIDINPGARIGENFCIDHGTGVVIGETTLIGNSVKLYQGVTLGALSVDKTLAATKRHPTLEDNVVIYAGSTVLGGKTVIGHDSVIGGNVWLTESVPPHSVVYHKSEVKIRSGKQFSEPNNFVI